MLLVRERAPLRLDVDIATADNHHARWGMDEVNPSNVPGGLTFSSTMPGGFEAMSCVLERQPERDYSDLEELSTITVRGAGGQIAWQGRLERTPRVSGDQLSVSPAAVGWQAHLDDDASAAMIYIDRELSRWGAASVQRQINLVGASLGLNVFSFQAQPDQSSGAPSLMFTAPGGWTGKQLTEAWYDASHVGGVGRVRWQNDLFIAIAGNDPNVLLGVFACTDDVASSFIGSNLDLTPNGPGDFGIAPVFAPGQYRFALLQAGYGISGGSPDGTFGYAFQNLAVIGTHGLSIHPGPSGVSPGIDDGVLASEVIAHAIGRWAPKLSFSTGPDGTIRPSTFVIPHLAFTEPGTVSQIVKAATAFGLPDWGVWPGPDGKPTFYCADRGTFAKSWRARVYPARLQETGPQVDRLWNGVLVSFADVAGITRTVGPPGSGADVEDVSLLDADPLNPVNEAGIRRYTPLQMGTSTSAGAIKVGATFLQASKELNSSGQASLVGHVEDDHGVLWPAWKVRSGDEISFVDAHDSSPRRVVQAAWDDSSKTMTVQLDAPPQGLEWLLARLGAVVQPLGF